MMVLVSYDIRTVDKAGERRLRRVAKACQDVGQRVQFSVFEMDVEPAHWILVRRNLCALIDPSTDSLRFYFLGKNWRGKLEHVGAKPAADFDAPLVF